MANAPVSFTLTGPGSLDATSVSTDSNGEAIVTYAPPPGGAGGSAKIDATIGTGAAAKTDSVTLTVVPTNIVVSVSPSSVTLGPGQTTQFSATVSGTSNTGVTWIQTGGGITQTGFYTAGATAGHLHRHGAERRRPHRDGKRHRDDHGAGDR
jgi:hypothetical protein